MSTNGEHPLIKVTRSSALAALVTGVVLFGGLSLFLVYVGTIPMKLAILAAPIIAVVGIRPYRVFPFGRLFSNRTQTHLKDPLLRPFMELLEEQKGRYLPLVSTVWFVVQAVVGVAGLLDPPYLTTVLEKGGHVFELLAPWPLLQSLTDWLFISLMTGVFGLAGTASVLYLSFHMFALWDRRT